MISVFSPLESIMQIKEIRIETGKALDLISIQIQVCVWKKLGNNFINKVYENWVHVKDNNDK